MKHCPECRAEMDDEERICPQCPYKEPVKEPVTALDFFNRGVEYHKKGKVAEAIADLQKALELDSQMSSARFRLALVYGDNGSVLLKMGMLKQAMDSLALSLQTQPLATVFNQRSMAFLSMNQPQKAIEDASNSIQLDPTFFPAYITRANVYHKLGNIDLAIADNTKAIELAPEYALAYRNRAREYLSQKEYPRAIVDLDQAIRLEPGNASAYCDRANAHAQQKDYEKAISDCNEAIRLAPQLMLVYEHRARLFRLMGNRSAARADELMIHPRKWWEFWR